MNQQPQKNRPEASTSTSSSTQPPAAGDKINYDSSSMAVASSSLVTSDDRIMNTSAVGNETTNSQASSTEKPLGSTQPSAKFCIVMGKKTCVQQWGDELKHARHCFTSRLENA